MGFKIYLNAPLYWGLAAGGPEGKTGTLRSSPLASRCLGYRRTTRNRPSIP